MQGDLDRFFARLVPDGDPLFGIATRVPTTCRHTFAPLSRPFSCRMPIVDLRLVLGMWQELYLWEHRTRPHRREVVLQLLGE